MAVSRPPCPRCGRWHAPEVRCDQRVALRAYVTVTSAQQEAADVAEAISLARYWFKRQG
jgi:hypothetical protein